MNDAKKGEIAIIGMACRFPGAGDYHEFWKNLDQGVNSISEIPPERWDIAGYYSTDINAPGKTISKWCGLVDDFNSFDHRFFNISPREASRMDPQQRLLVEETWRCVEDAGISLKELQRKKTGVYIGVMAVDHQKSGSQGEVDAYSATGGYEGIIANRVSYLLGLTGPSYSIDAACASSLVAIHQAKEVLLKGDCDYALAGGVSLNLHPWKYISFSKARMLSPDGQCKTFDKEANGYVPGDGVGVLLLCRLSDALKYGRRIYGKIKGSAVNHSGKTLSLTAPRLEAQREVISAAYREAGVGSERITYVEAHGTGTSLGDPIEVEALKRIFRKRENNEPFCGLGSVKTNIGHLEAAAGVAGVVKVLLMMRKRRFVPHLNFKELNPVIDLEDSPFKIVTESVPWEADFPRLAGVSSLGMGGINSHLLLEEFSEPEREKQTSGEKELFVLSAPSSVSLQRLVSSWKEFLKTEDAATLPPRDLSGTLTNGRQSFDWRLGFPIEDLNELKNKLDRSSDSFIHTEDKPIWMKIGHWDLSDEKHLKALLKDNRTLESHFQRLEESLDFADLTPRLLSFLLLQAYALTLKDMGAVFKGFAYEGDGIWNALVLSGALSLKDAAKIFNGELKIKEVSFSRLTASLHGPFERSVINPWTFDEDYLKDLLADPDPEKKVMAFYLDQGSSLIENQFTFKKYLEEWDKPLRDEGLRTVREYLEDRDSLKDDTRKSTLAALIIVDSLRRLNMKWDISFDPKTANPAFKELLSLMSDSLLSKKALTKLFAVGFEAAPEVVVRMIISHMNDNQGLVDPQKEYSILKDRQYPTEIPALLSCGLGKSEEDLFFEDKRLVELGVFPGVNGDGDSDVISILLPESLSLKEVALRFWNWGVDVDWGKVYPVGSYQTLSLPCYPFEKNISWSGNTKGEDHGLRDAPSLHPLLDINISTLLNQAFVKELRAEQFYLKDHLVKGEMVFPAAASLEMAMEAAERSNSGSGIVSLKNATWLRPLKVGGEPVKIKLTLHPEKDKMVWRVTENGKKREIVYCQGEVQYHPRNEENSIFPSLDLEEVEKRCSRKKDKKAIYSLLEKSGLGYGPAFRVIESFRSNESEALAKLKLPASLKEGFNEFGLHPVLVDGALQTVVALFSLIGGGSGLPFSLKKAELLKPLKKEVHAYATFAAGAKPKAGIFDILIADSDGETLAVLEGLSLRGSASKLEKSLWFAPKWETVPIDGNAGDFSGDVLVVDSDEALAETLRRRLIGREVVSLGAKDDREAAVRELAEENRLPEAIVYRPGRAETIERKLENSFFALFELTKALLESKVESIKLIYLHRNDSDQKLFDRAISAFSKTASLEKPTFFYRSVGLDDTSNAEAVSDKILKELASDDRTVQVRYRNEQRESWNFEEFRSRELNPGGSLLKKGGVYLITGGLGGLGLIMAEYLAGRYQAKLVLAGRSEPTKDKDRKLSELKRTGAECLYIRTDVSDFEEVEKLIEKAKERFGEINGVVHAAGVVRDGLILNKTEVDARAVLEPKIKGAINLDSALKDEKLDFMVFFSSIVGVLGNVGQADYAFANSFPNGFAEERERLVSEGERFGRSLSIAWPLWDEGGMKPDQAGVDRMKRSWGSTPLETDVGLDLFEKSLLADKTVLLPATDDSGKLKRSLERPSPSTPVPERTEELSTTAKAELENLLTAELIKIAAAVIEVEEEELDEDENISRYGFDSVSFSNFVELLNEKFGLELSPPIMFEQPTISDLSSYLLREHEKNLFEVYRHSLNTSIEPVETETELEESSAVELPPKPRFVSSEPIAAKVKSEATGHVAVIGMAARTPGANNLREFWRNLLEGKNCVGEVPPERWDWRRYEKKEKCFVCIKWGGFLKDIDKFDAGFFNISPREAELMDPQHRLFLETVWETLEDAGYKASDLDGAMAGVFAGICSADYQMLLQSHNVGPAPHIPTGNAYSTLVNRVSYFFNWKGPSEAVDTACSSSISALHRALRAIKSGDCELAVAGGVNLMLTPDSHLSFSQAGMLSEGGHCKTFDIHADGYARGEGVGAVLLKPLAQAVKDGDRIYGVIKGSAVNHGGRVSSLTAPNPNAQAELVVNAHQQAGISPDSVGYIECHGTGTVLGDPIEINGLKKAFVKLYQERGLEMPANKSCTLGSVKSNIGHAEAAAGIIGMIKTLLLFQHKKIPGMVHFKKLNPYVELDDTPFYISPELQDWRPLKDKSGRIFPLRAGVSSFGFGGSNAHVVLEEYRNEENKTRTGFSPPCLIILSAKNEERLRAYAGRFIRFLEKHEEEVSIVDLAYTLQIGREAMDERLALLAEDKRELLDKLEKYLKTGRKASGLYLGNVGKNRSENELLVADEEGMEFIDSIIKKGRLSKLGRLWVSGVEIDWNLLYGEIKPCRISLPTYPFAKNRHWAAERSEPEGSKASVIHPLLHSGVSELDRRNSGSIFSGKELSPSGRQVKKRKKLMLSLPTYPFAKDRHWLDAAYEERPESKASKASVIHPLLHSDVSELDRRNVGSIFTGKELFPSGRRGEERKKLLLTLPTYPFARERHWLDAAKTEHAAPRTAKASVIHPLLHSNTSNLIRQSYSSIFTGEELFLKDHVINGQKVMSAAAYLEMARAAVTEATPARHQSAILELSNTVWTRPISVAENKGITIALSANANGQIDYEIYSVNAEQEVIHCRGEAIFSDKQPPAKLDIQRLQGQMTRSRQGASDLYPAFSRMGMDYGTSYQGITTVYQGDNQALVQLSLPVDVEDGSKNYLLPPGMIDGALQASFSLISDISQLSGQPLSPFDLDFLSIVSGCSEKMYAWTRYSQVNESKAKGFKLDIDLCDEQGNICVLMRGLSLGPSAIEAADRESVRQSSGANDISPGQLATARSHEEPRQLEEYPPTKAEQSVLATARHNRVIIPLSARTKEQLSQKVHDLLAFLSALKQSAEPDAMAGLKEKLQERITNQLAKLLGVESEQLESEQDFTNYGVEKLHLSNISENISQEYGFNINLEQWLRKDTIASLVDYCLKRAQDGQQNDQSGKQVVSEKIDLTAIAYTLQVGRDHMEKRLALLVENKQELLDKLDDYLKSDKTTPGLYLGSVEKGSFGNELLVADEDGMDFINYIIQKGKLSKLAQLWVSGVEIDWNLLYAKTKPLKISLPAYPFAKDHYRQKKSDAARASEDIPADNDISSIVAYLKRHISAATGLPEADLDIHEDLENYGFNSIIITELMAKLEKATGEKDPSIFFASKNIYELAEKIEETYGNVLVSSEFSSRMADNASACSGQPEFVEKIAPKATSKNIAIIGISGKYPEADSLYDFFDNLQMAKDCITKIPKERWNPSEQTSGQSDTYPKWGGFISDVNKFDYDNFKISLNEALSIHPEERLLLEQAWHCFENAGYNPLSWRKDNNNEIGVYIGASFHDYQYIVSEHNMDSEEYLPFTSQIFSYANRLSYFFNLTGPSVALDTACSSSLHAVLDACNAIRNGSCKAAIAGGVNLQLHPDKFKSLDKYNFLSQKGGCYSFVEGGDGYVPGEGIGLIMLKTLDDAVIDNDNILAVIKGLAAGNDGKTNGFTVPNPESQSRIIEKALNDADISPETISLVECHGTGTALGDPIEISALSKTFGKYTSKLQYCAVSSVKSNIGHLEAAAGIAQLTKVILQLKNKVLFPNVMHSPVLNKNIRFPKTPFYVQKEFAPWDNEMNESPRRVGVSSFGAGGDNVHLVLEEHREHSSEREGDQYENFIIPFSADSKEQLYKIIQDTCDYLSDSIRNIFSCEYNVKDIAGTLTRGRAMKTFRMAVVCEENIQKFINYLKQALECFNNNEFDSRGIFYGSTNNKLKNEKKLHIPTSGSLSYESLADTARHWTEGSYTLGIETYFDFKKVCLPGYNFKKKSVNLKKHESSQTASHDSQLKVASPKYPEEPLKISSKSQLQSWILGVFKKIMGAIPGDFDENESFSYYGIDSISGSKIHAELVARHSDLDDFVLIEHNTLLSLTTHLFDTYYFEAEPDHSDGSENEEMKEVGKIKTLFSDEAISDAKKKAAGSDINSVLMGFDKLIKAYEKSGGKLKIEINKVRLTKGEEIEFVVCGKGKPVIFLPPFNSTASIWIQQILELSKYFQIIVIHYPGIGNSDWRKDLNSFNDLARNTVEIIDKMLVNQHIRTKKVSMVGASFGGFLAQTIAVEYPEYVDRLVLISTTSISWSSDEYNITAEEFARKSALEFKNNYFKLPAFVKNMPEIRHLLQQNKVEGFIVGSLDRRVIDKYFLMIARFRHLNIAEKLQAKTYLISSSKDELMPAKFAKRLHKKIKNSVTSQKLRGMS